MTKFRVELSEGLIDVYVDEKRIKVSVISYKGFVEIIRNDKVNSLDLINVNEETFIPFVNSVGDVLVFNDEQRDKLIVRNFITDYVLEFDSDLYVTILNKDNKVVLEEYNNKEETRVIKEEKDFSLSLLEGHKHHLSYHDFETQINIKLDKDTRIYGLGDKASSVNRRGYEYVQYNTDDPSQHNESYKSLYKSINYVMLKNTNSTFCGVCYLSTYKTIFNLGCYSPNFMYIASFKGEYDYFVILGDNPSEISKTYNTLFNKMYIPSLKHLGYHQSRWSYKNEDEVMDVFNNFKKFDIPLDFIDLDIDYMDRYMVYTIDSSKFPDMNKLIDTLNSNNVDLVPIIDPAVKMLDGYEIYDQMKSKGLFAVCNNSEQSDYVNEVWPGESCYPNYFSVECQRYITDITKEFLTKYKFNGIWTDMNEPASFKGALPDDVLFKTENGVLHHDEVHNLYASYMTKAINRAFLELNRRPFVITRAGFMDCYTYATCWNGDNQSLYSHLQASLPQVATMNICNYVFNGVDIGGFGNECTKELLIRWYEANIFSLFYRNHSTINSRHQEPYAFDKECLDIVRKYIRLHYKFIPYLYTLLRDNYDNGQPVISPMFYHNYKDCNCDEINDQVMIGKDMILCPILHQGEKSRSIYLPKGRWVNYFTKEVYEGNKYHLIHLNIDEVGLFINEEAIIPMFKEELNNIDVNREYELEFFYTKNSKHGVLYEDDFVSNNYRDGIFNKYELSVENNRVVSKAVVNNLDKKKFIF